MKLQIVNEPYKGGKRAVLHLFPHYTIGVLRPTVDIEFLREDIAAANRLINREFCGRPFGQQRAADYAVERFRKLCVGGAADAALEPR